MSINTPPNDIRVVLPAACPHCSENVFFSFKMPTPEVQGIYTQQDIDEAKNDVRAFLNTLSLNDDVQSQLTSWLDDPQTMFTKDDADEIKVNIKNEYVVTKEA